MVDDKGQIRETELLFDAGRYPMQVDSVHGAAPVQERSDQALEWVYFMSNLQIAGSIVFGDKLDFRQSTLIGKGQLFAVALWSHAQGLFLRNASAISGTIAAAFSL